MDHRVQIRSAVAALSLVLAGAVHAQSVDAPGLPLFRHAQPKGGLPVLRVDVDALRTAKRTGGREFVVEGFPLTIGAQQLGVDLELAEFKVTEPATRYVLGEMGQADRPIAFDPDSFTFLRGTVRGYPASHVFVAVSERISAARIDLGPGHPRFLLSDRGGHGVPLEQGELVVFPAVSSGSLLAGVPSCGVDHDARLPDDAGARGPLGTGGLPTAPPAPRGVIFQRGLQQIELAVETDYELFELFGNAEDTAAYVTMLYAAVSDIYIRDVNSRMVLSYVRIWDNPNDLFNAGDDPLNSFVSYWNNNMGSVHRDVAQFFTGRRNLSAGGVAYVNALCNNSSYSWAGYALGFFGDPDNASWTNRDIMVTAHELGHNCGTYHTHDYGLDTCDQETSPPRRGSIMSYCGQTFSGGDANHDLWFHEFTANIMRNYIAQRGCIADDCNANNIPDTQDITAGVLHDMNLNGVPDECEDCNGNGILDPQEIALGLVADVNANGIPDPCEPDCNANNIPDTYEITQNPQLDLNANRIPDLCEGDLNHNGIADYNEIQANMALDINRNLMLDSVEDCDADGITNLVELDHAWNCYVGSAQAGAPLREFYAVTGVQMNIFSDDAISDVQDLIITPDRRILVSSAVDNMVREFAPDGSFIRTLISPGAGGVSSPAGLLLTRGGASLLVASRNSNRVLEYNAANGAFVGIFAGADTPPILPFGLAVGPSGNLLVSCGDHSIREYDIASGAFVRVLVAAGSGGLNDPRGLLTKPDGNLLVCSWNTNSILEFEGASGAFLRQWSRVGTPTRLTFENPWCIRLGPDGDVYATRSDTHAFAPGDPKDLHLTNARIYQFDIRNGNFVRAYLQGVDSALSMPTGFDFMPGDPTDCNMNHLPDSCDIAAGTSRDCNANGIPDDCDIRAGAPDVNHDGVPDTCQCLPDWNLSGVVNSQDFFDFLRDFFNNMADFNGSGSTNSQDLFDYLTAFFNGC